MGNQFAIDVTAIRDDAREKMSAGAVTAGNRSPVDRVVEVLDAVLATEIVCYLRYTQNAITASGIHTPGWPPNSPSTPRRNSTTASASPNASSSPSTRRSSSGSATTTPPPAR